MDWHVCQKQSPPWFIAVWCTLDPSRFLLLMGQGYDLFCNPKHAGILSYMVLCHKGCKTIKKEHTPRFFWGFFLHHVWMKQIHDTANQGRSFLFLFFLSSVGLYLSEVFTRTAKKSCNRAGWYPKSDSGVYSIVTFLKYVLVSKWQSETRSGTWTDCQIAAETPAFHSKTIRAEGNVQEFL